MSYFLQAIKLYPNYLFYDSSDKEKVANFSSSAEPSITGESYTSSNGDTTGGAFDLVDNKRSTQVVIDSDSQSTNPVIDIDLTTSLGAMTHVLIDNANLGTCDAKFSVQIATVTQSLGTCYESTFDYVTANGQLQLEPMTVTSDVCIPAGDGTYLIHLDASPSGSDWQIYFDYPSGAGIYSADIAIGELVISKVWTAPHAPSVDEWEESLDWPAVVINTPGGQKYGLGSHGERRTWRLNWTHMAQANFLALQEAFRVTHGGKNPMFFDLGEHATQPRLYYGRFSENSFRARPIAGGTVWNVSFSLTTDV